MRCGRVAGARPRPRAPDPQAGAVATPPGAEHRRSTAAAATATTTATAIAIAIGALPQAGAAARALVAQPSRRGAATPQRGPFAGARRAGLQASCAQREIAPRSRARGGRLHCQQHHAEHAPWRAVGVRRGSGPLLPDARMPGRTIPRATCPLHLLRPLHARTVPPSPRVERRGPGRTRPAGRCAAAPRPVRAKSAPCAHSTGTRARHTRHVGRSRSGAHQPPTDGRRLGARCVGPRGSRAATVRAVVARGAGAGACRSGPPVDGRGDARGGHGGR